MIKLRKRLLVGFVATVLTTITSYGTPLNTYERDIESKNGVVAAAKPEASKVGVKILEEGGNAVDAAIATAFAIGVLEPNASGLGGGGFMLIKPANGDPVVIDFREEAPGKATPDMYTLDENGKAINHESTVGGKAVGVPGETTGLLTALKKYGTMSRRQVMQPAIDYAYNGIPVTVNLSSIISDNYEKISKYPATAKIYLNDGLPYEVGDKIKNPDYGKTLEKIANNGAKAFYRGEIAEKIANEVQKEGGILTTEDLENYFVKIRKPIEGTYRGYEIISTPPASSGGTHVIELLNMMENFDLRAMGDNTAKTWHVWSEAMRQMYSDRSEYMGDTDFVKVPLKGLTSKEYAKNLVEKFDLEKPSVDKIPGEPWKYESESTTHIAVMDKEGNMVSITKSINYFFGSGVVVPGTGILLNNHMDDFVAEPGHKNSIEAGKRPLSSMSPTVVLDPKGRPFMAIGSPGATRIITAVALTISNVIDHGMNIQEAINAPRITQYQFGSLKAEGRISAVAYNKLKEMGHEIDLKDYYAPYFGGVHAVMMDYSRGILEGGADPRRDGVAAGF